MAKKPTEKRDPTDDRPQLEIECVECERVTPHLRPAKEPWSCRFCGRPKVGTRTCKPLD